ncbi:hypothetical protein AVEN_38957-1 [Araneus ventricosus]|uniref:Uncharacterized protein n=1 Tax=Araneus ventricosus TaxID=182803 RepID=A0A4Y2PZQ6_ARAVE|nr:hypothetical protein AVEN_38957-1 [Araneus ventricosus]
MKRVDLGEEKIISILPKCYTENIANISLDFPNSQAGKEEPKQVRFAVEYRANCTEDRGSLGKIISILPKVPYKKILQLINLDIQYRFTETKIKSNVRFTLNT